ncbi:MAG: bifunctional riboflavin kinase/FAD synthetase [Deltaproteobacteria bacterium]|nr:bifunctional riboflavin kinase/FAD synthetase [Deltaproteobacteria bacterium]
MPIIYNLNELNKPLKNAVLTIGNFDGVHKGHLVLFDLVKKRAKAIHGKSAVMTFEPHPIKVIKPESGPPLITPTERKLKLISNAGLDIIFCLPFTREFAAISAQDFVKGILVDEVNVKELIVGYDYTFGNERKGGIDLLKQMGKELGFIVHVVEPVYFNNTLVSSTSVRNFILEGNLKEAKKLLGRNYQITGTVTKGAGRGGKIVGFSTANIEPVNELIPRKGVYAVYVDVDGINYYGVCNIGYNPTFGNDKFSIETHILDFDRDITGETIYINFIHHIRDERKFNSVDELSAQIADDIGKAKKLLGLYEQDQ